MLFVILLKCGKLLHIKEMNYLSKPVLFDTDKHYCDTTGFSSGSVLNCGTRVQVASDSCLNISNRFFVGTSSRKTTQSPGAWKYRKRPIYTELHIIIPNCIRQIQNTVNYTLF